MIVNISWIQFQQHFMKTSNLVYVLEELESWCVYTGNDGLVIKCRVPKSESPEQNFMFVDTYLNGINIIKVEGVVESHPINLRFMQE